MEGPHLEDIIEAWQDGERKDYKVDWPVHVVKNPPNACADNYILYGGIREGKLQLWWAGLGTVSTGGLLSLACVRLSDSTMPTELTFEGVFGFPPGQTKPEREERAFGTVASLLAEIEAGNANRNRD